MSAGLFITLEGIEGAGKTTQMDALKSFLTAQGHTVRTTREPGGTPIGRSIRAILLDAGNCDLDFRAELLLYAADRAQHVWTQIRPALEKGHTVICDRYVDATLAYQGFGRGLSLGFIEQVHALSTDHLHPDLTLLFDLPVESGLRRAWRRIENGTENGQTRFEEEKAAFHQAVRDGYLQLARQFPQRYRVIDADQNQQQVQQALQAQVQQFLSQRANT